MAGKKIKNDVVASLISLQHQYNRLVKGFPLFCYIIGEIEDDINFFKDQYFHDSDIVNILPYNTDWEHIAVTSKLFDSRGDARKNNFNGHIPKGWHEVTSGKGIYQQFIFVLKL